MKKETRDVTRTIKESKDFYIADDGEEFSTEEQCREYEASAQYAYSKRLAGVLTPINRERAQKVIDNICDDGRCECDYYCFKPKTEDDLKNFIAYAHAACGGYFSPNTQYYKDHPENNYIYVPAEELAVGETYIFFNRCGEWGGIVSHKSLMTAVDKCFDETLWIPPEKKEGE